MQLDMAKLFPQACGQSGKKKLIIRYQDIGDYGTTTVKTAGFINNSFDEHYLNLKDGKRITFKVNDKDDGIDILSAVGAAFNIWDDWSINKDNFTGENRLKLEQEKNQALQFITYCRRKYS